MENLTIFCQRFNRVKQVLIAESSRVPDGVNGQLIQYFYNQDVLKSIATYAGARWLSIRSLNSLSSAGCSLSAAVKANLNFLERCKSFGNSALNGI